MKAKPSKQKIRNTPDSSQEGRTEKQLSTGPTVPKTKPTFDDVHARITARAYELYVERGRRVDCAEQDWLDAEREILNHAVPV